MSTSAYQVRWLSPEDSAQVAAVEARVHAPEHCAGERVIWAQLQETESDGRNLSMALYHEGRLVGFGLAFVMRDRKEMAEFFDVSVPLKLNASQPTIYISDYVVQPEHRRASLLLSGAFSAVVRARADLRRLSIDAFSTTEYMEKWSARARFIAKQGWRLTGIYDFHDTKLDRTMHWLSLDRIEEAVAQPPLDTLRAAPATVFETSEYRRLWDEYFSVIPEESADEDTPDHYRIVLQGSWPRYFFWRPTVLRKSLADCIAYTQSQGVLRFELLPPERTKAALQTYFDLEQCAPDDELGCGASISSRHIAFHRALAQRHALTLGMRIGFLSLNGEPIAGLVVFFWHGRCYLAHCTRHEDYARFGASRLLLARFIELCFEERLCAHIELTDANCADAPLWATHQRTASGHYSRYPGLLARMLRHSP